jgi:hypothetical protein
MTSRDGRDQKVVTERMPRKTRTEKIDPRVETKSTLREVAGLVENPYHPLETSQDHDPSPSLGTRLDEKSQAF